MHKHSRLILCLAASLWLAPSAFAQTKSQKLNATPPVLMQSNKGNVAACAISIPDIAIAEVRQKHGANSIAEAAIQQELGDLYIKKGNYKNAETAFRKAIAILQTPSNAKAHQDILGDCFEGIGYVLMDKKEYAKAVDAFKQWIATMEKNGHLAQDPSSEIFAMALDRLSDAYVNQKNFRAAEPLLKRSLAMRKVTYGEYGSTTEYVMEHLLEVYDGLGKTAEIAKLENSLIESKKRELGTELGAFYAQQAHQSRKLNSVLPLIAALGPGAQWNQKKFTQEIEKKLGTASDATWYKIPNWFAGLWGEDIPKGVKVEEINGVLRPPDENSMAFHTGPSPVYATRRGFVRARDNSGWWHYDENNAQSNWTQSGRSDSKNLGYIYYQNMRPVTNGDGSVTFRTVSLHFDVKPKVAYNFNSLFPAGTVFRVWQQDKIMTYKQVAPCKYALFTCERMYNWNGKEKRVTTEGNKVFWIGGASWQKKIGEAAPAKFVGIDLKQDLKKYLAKHRMLDELKRLEK